MKRIFIYITVLIVFVACSQAPSYKITGDIIGLDGTIYLMHEVEMKLIKVDSTELIEGEFIFEGSVKSPEKYALTFKNNGVSIPLILENSEINIIGDIKNPKAIQITGSASQDIMNIYKETIIKPFMEKRATLSRAYKEAKVEDVARAEEIRGEYNKLVEERTITTLDFIKSNNKSYVAVLLASQQQINDADKLDELVASIDVSLMDNNLVIGMKEKAKALRAVAIGQLAPDFTLNDTEGNPVKLSSLYGKGYLLIDFWASWCAPCRKENPHVLAAYNKYHEKGFEILAVSYDEKKEKWLEAIKKDHLPWIHVSDLKGWKNLTAKLYSISGIPANVLLDKEGRIIAKDLRGEALKEKLAELMD